MNDGPMDAPAPTRTASSWLTRQNALALLLIVLTLFAFFVCFLMLRPFLSALAWALALAIVAHPLHTWIKRHMHNATASALSAVVIVAVILITPTIFVLHQLLLEAAAGIDLMQSPDEQSDWRHTLEHSPVGEWYQWLNAHVDLSAQINQAFGNLAAGIVGVVRESIWTVMSLLITLLTLFYLFRDRHEALNTLRTLVPLSQAETDEVLRLVQETIHATVYGSVMMAVLQGTLGGLIFWLLDLPSPVVWGVVMALLATVPNLGAFVVWVPAALGLALQEEWGKAAILGVYGLTAISLIDNLLYPIVVGTRMRMHSLPVFFAILGGIIVFGPAGLILGPVVFALTHALIEIWRRRTRNGQAAECGVAPLVTEAAQIRKETPPALLQEPAAIVREASR